MLFMEHLLFIIVDLLKVGYSLHSQGPICWRVPNISETNIGNVTQDRLQDLCRHWSTWIRLQETINGTAAVVISRIKVAPGSALRRRRTASKGILE